jgi:predicted dehydrogenase
VATLRAGKHVLVEKPMALTGQQADELIAEAGRSGRILMVAQVLRFWPDYVALREALGSLGTVRTALFRRRCAAPAWSKWITDPGKSGGGVFDLLIHDADMCIHLFGLPEAVSATGHEDDATGIDFICAQLHYANLPSVTITGGWHHPKGYPFSMEYTVQADRGTIEYSSAGRPATLYRSDGTSEALPLSSGGGFEGELRYFVDCCRERRPPKLCPPAESAAAVKLMLAMVEARKHKGDKIPCRF